MLQFKADHTTTPPPPYEQITDVSRESPCPPYESAIMYLKMGECLEAKRPRPGVQAHIETSAPLLRFACFMKLDHHVLGHGSTSFAGVSSPGSTLETRPGKVLYVPHRGQDRPCCRSRLFYFLAFRCNATAQACPLSEQCYSYLSEQCASIECLAITETHSR
ncbi:hypothetical protein VTK56DRAFT_7987 [Thermocarpiscus australiensis]